MKQIKHCNFRIEVYPKAYYRIAQEDGCKEIAAEINEHIRGISIARVIWDTEETCEYCGYAWEEDDNGSPVCCKKAKHEWEQAREETKKDEGLDPIRRGGTERRTIAK